MLAADDQDDDDDIVMQDTNDVDEKSTSATGGDAAVPERVQDSDPTTKAAAETELSGPTPAQAVPKPTPTPILPSKRAPGGASPEPVQASSPPLEILETPRGFDPDWQVFGRRRCSPCRYRVV